MEESRGGAAPYLLPGRALSRPPAAESPRQQRVPVPPSSPSPRPPPSPAWLRRPRPRPGAAPWLWPVQRCRRRPRLPGRAGSGQGAGVRGGATAAMSRGAAAPHGGVPQPARNAALDISEIKVIHTKGVCFVSLRPSPNP